jgi:ATP-binding protein involved in chromosome partitioning
MKPPAIYLKKIYQKDHNTFVIDWSDGLSHDFRLASLQKRCPCAQCYDPATGQQLCRDSQIDPDVQAATIQNVGRYAIRVQFQSGCSKGIYSFSFLRQLAKEGANV